ncbi:membrane-targeted effector domain-containing toxin [Pseudomonas massiliensis]|uniref:membrane-targeted effector domain-containing toxin n=1 Tax=Pseudomonas massiliensis TaxID=522492 RepID=UPI00058D451F|nr:membrane-targeted effector domain-containing toxin [Pseudomonas massiliensis]
MTQTPPGSLHPYLQALAQTLARSCPDLRESIRRLAAEFLQAHGLPGLDPDRVYWHRFAEAVSSPRAFTGWAHYAKPSESMTLAQLVMHRFNSNDQDAQDQLDQLSGFYTVGPDAPVFDERNEVRVLPHQLLEWLWATDPKTRLLNHTRTFWREHQADFRLLAKAHFIAQGLEARQTGAISDADLGYLFGVLAGGAHAELDMQQLTAECAADTEGTRVYLLQIGECQSSDLLGVENAKGEHFLWVPGSAGSLHKFESIRALRWWLLEHTKDAEGRARFVLHFPLKTRLEASDNDLNHSIDQLFYHWGSLAGDAWIHHPEQRLAGDAFTALACKSRERMLDDAQLLLLSNAQQRKKMWLGYLGAANQVFGPMAALDWPVALAVVGAGLADIGLNVDQALNAPLRAEREAGVAGAIVASINTLFNGLYLWGAWANPGNIPENEVIPERASFGEADTTIELPELPDQTTLLAQPTEVTPQANLLAHYEANVILDAYPLGTEGRAAGIYALPGGANYVSIEGLPYRVRYSAQLQTWMIVDPEQPFAFHDCLPLARTEAGSWVVAPGVRLQGGAPFGNLWPWARYPRLRITPYVPGRYDLPAQYEQRLCEIILDPENRTLRGYVDPSTGDSGLFASFEQRQDQLTEDAWQFFQRAVAQPHPSLEPLAASMPGKQVVRSIFAQSRGLVIGEAHSHIAGKQFLVEQLPNMAKEGVQTLYMEHLLTDANQTDLDALATTGKLPPRLRQYLKDLDEGHETDPDGRYTFRAVVKAAAKSRIRIKALDCAASYGGRVSIDLRNSVRQQRMNYYAHELMRTAPPEGKWVALVGNTHSDRYLQALGLADLEGVVSLRAEDVPLGVAAGIEPDEGVIVPRTDRRSLLVRSDLRLRVPNRRPGVNLDKSVETRLAARGSFLIAQRGQDLEMLHRSRAGEIVRTPVVRAHGRFVIHRDQWPQVSGRAYASLERLIAALQAMGLTPVD